MFARKPEAKVKFAKELVGGSNTQKKTCIGGAFLFSGTTQLVQRCYIINFF